MNINTFECERVKYKLTFVNLHSYEIIALVVDTPLLRLTFLDISRFSSQPMKKTWKDRNNFFYDVNMYTIIIIETLGG